MHHATGVPTVAPTVPAGETAFYLDDATGIAYIWRPGAAAWAALNGPAADATTTTPGVGEIDHAPSGPHPVMLTTDSIVMPSGLLGTTATKAAAGNDARLSDARVPTAHEATHLAGGSDALPWTTIHDVGTLGARPAGAATNAGYVYYASDVGIVYRSDGATWTPQAVLRDGLALPAASADYVGTFYIRTGDSTLWYCTATPAWVQIAGSYTLPAATVAALGGVRIDKAPASGDPVAITAAGITPAATAGAPTSGTYLAGELYVDSAYVLYVCSAGGTPGTWHAVSGAGGAMTQLSHQVVAAATNTISFPSIPSTYNHLMLVLYGRSNNSDVNDFVNLRFNGDSSANYDYQIMYGNGGGTSGAESFAATAALAGVISGATSPTGTASGFTLEIPVYAGTTFHKTALAAGGTKHVTTTGGLVVREVALWWRSAAAITQIDLTCVSGQFMVGTVATLYGRT